MIDKKSTKIERGIKINAGFKQIVVSSFVILVFLVLPIYVMENNISVQDLLNRNTNTNPYSSEALSKRTGQVAGISTSAKEQSSSNQIITLPLVHTEVDLSSFTGDSLVILIIGVILITVAFFLFLYLILGKFNV